MANTTENSIRIFENEAFGQVHTVVKDGEPWFVAADVCKALELDQVTRAISRLDEDERSTTLISSNPSFGGTKDTEMNIVNEAGLYALVLGSRKPEAKAFKRWITHEVLPCIRETGLYAAETVTSDMMFQLAKAMQEKEQRIAALQAENHQQAQQLAQAKPKVLFAA